jgi:hypothetical protein
MLSSLNHTELPIRFAHRAQTLLHGSKLILEELILIGQDNIFFR